MKLSLLIIFLFFSLYSPLSALAQENGEDISIGKYYKINSSILKETRTILISLPDGYEEGDDHYPVIFVLYANQVREYFAEAVAVVNRLTGAGDIPPMIIVGITNLDRYGDLLPVSARPGKEPGAPAFLSFMQKELLPWLQNNYRTTEFNIIMGPQAGAPFAIFAMKNGGNAFNAAIINNPFWPLAAAAQSKLSLREMFSEETSLSRFVHITYRDDIYGEKKLKKYVHDLEKTYREIAPGKFKLDVDFLADNDDFIVPTGLKRGLKLLFKGYRLEDFSNMTTLDEISLYFQKLSEKVGCQLDIPYLTLVFFGDHLIKEGKQEQGEAVYHHVIKTFPASVDGLYRMAEIYRNRGEKEKALNFYRKCIERNQDMAHAREWITKLEAEPKK